MSTSRNVAPDGSSARHVAGGITATSSSSSSARSRRSPRSRRRSTAGRATDRRTARGSGRGPSLVGDDRRLVGIERVEEPSQDGRDERRHVAADDDHAFEAGSSARQPGRRDRRADPRRRRRRGRCARRSGHRWPDVRCRDHRRCPVRRRATASMHAVEHRSAVDGLGELVAPEPRRPAAGEDDRRDRGRSSGGWRPAPSDRARGRPGSAAGSPAGRGPRGSP